ARMHDGSLKYVLSDNAIVALAEKVPVTEADISTTISQADTHLGFLNSNSTTNSPSSVFATDPAKHVDEDPPAIMLLFEHKGQLEDEGNDFHTQIKKNMCVGCGEGNHYLRHCIIPSCYRTHFPAHLKCHRHGNILLVCVDCHEKANSFAEKYKKKLASDYEIPLFVNKVVKGVSHLELRTAAMALLRYRPRMPPQRREEFTQVLGVKRMNLGGVVTGNEGGWCAKTLVNDSEKGAGSGSS
ncbi:RRP6-like protein 3 isoform X1, partial [Tanacetum coccineum]